MTKYITYMSVYHHSEGASPEEVYNKLKDLGWKPVYGAYDFAYEWDEQWGEKSNNFEEYAKYIAEVHNKLKGLNVYYNLWTTEYGKEDYAVYYSD
jgi:hypothetical protein